MAGRRDREEFGDPFHYSEHDRVDEMHVHMITRQNPSRMRCVSFLTWSVKQGIAE
jgi:hypothetical protein